MPTTLDCTLLRDFFGTERMREVFDSRRRLQGWLDAWGALAKAEAAVGIIPNDAASEIQAACRAENFDLDELHRGIVEGRHVLYPSIEALASRCGDAGAFVHWGATTQDIIDTGLALQIRSAMSIILGEIHGLMDTAKTLVDEYADQPMVGRTHFQHAVPITFGLKVASWLDQLTRDEKRLAEAGEGCAVATLAGAGGTLASIHPHGEAVEAAFAETLDLDVPAAPWFAARDRYGALVAAVGMLAATLERISVEIARLQGPDIAEIAEPRGSSQVGSSTMPQKHNPIISSRVAATCKMVRGLVPVMLDAMVVAHERDVSATTAEWLLIPQQLIMIDSALFNCHNVLKGLTIDADRMAANLEASAGQVTMEAVLFALAAHIGRLRAHDICLRASRSAKEADRRVADVLWDDLEVRSLLSRRDIEELLEPNNYLGRAEAIARSLAAS